MNRLYFVLLSFLALGACEKPKSVEKVRVPIIEESFPTLEIVRRSHSNRMSEVEFENSTLSEKEVVEEFSRFLGGRWVKHSGVDSLPLIVDLERKIAAAEDEKKGGSGLSEQLTMVREMYSGYTIYKSDLFEDVVITIFPRKRSLSSEEYPASIVVTCSRSAKDEAMGKATGSVREK